MERRSITTVQDKAFGDRLLTKLAGRRLPLTGQWELTCRCNLRCVMCYTDCFNTADMLRQELSFPEITRIMDEIQEAGCLELTLTGGEPLMRKDFLDIYTYAKHQGFLVTVFTNGTLITERLVEWWMQYPPAMIEISLHGLTKNSFERITDGPGSYERCVAGIHAILARKLPLTLKTTGMTVNRDEILKIKEYVDRLGQRYRTNVGYRFGSDIRPRLNGSEDVFEYQLSDADVIAIEQADPEFRAERSRQDDDRHAMVRQGQGLCAGGQRKFHIDAYGQLQLCSSNRRQSYDLRRGSFREGFYEVLPHFPCPARRPSGQETLLSIQPQVHRANTEEGV
jgi:MoaA/NifB/PqqE/SkfB family radical SAM enzyme